jgi:hypothetical protein
MFDCLHVLCSLVCLPLSRVYLACLRMFLNVDTTMETFILVVLLMIYIVNFITQGHFEEAAATRVILYNTYSPQSRQQCTYIHSALMYTRTQSMFVL